MVLRKAVIPAAGKGQRMAPISRVIPKEMLPIGFKPLLQYTLEEAAASGIEDVAIILSPEKICVKNYFNVPFNTVNKYDDKLKMFMRRIRIIFLEQETPNGVADAVSKARNFVGEEPFAYMLPDNFTISTQPLLKQMRDVFREVQNNVVGLIKVYPDDEGIFGNCGKVNVKHVKSSIYKVEKIYGKHPGLFPVDSDKPVIRAFARGILLPSFFELIEKHRAQTNAELDDVPLLQELAEQNRLFGCLLEGKSFDTGHPYGYLQAVQKIYQAKN